MSPVVVIDAAQRRSSLRLGPDGLFELKKGRRLVAGRASELALVRRESHHSYLDLRSVTLLGGVHGGRLRSGVPTVRLESPHNKVGDWGQHSRDAGNPGQ